MLVNFNIGQHRHQRKFLAIDIAALREEHPRLCLRYSHFADTHLEHIACQLLIFAACARRSGSYAERKVGRISARDFGLTDFRSTEYAVDPRNGSLLLFTVCAGQ
jgi:hypothetical protein